MRSATRPPRWGSVSTSPTSGPTSTTTTSGRPPGMAALHDLGFRGRIVLASAPWSSTATAVTAVPVTAPCARFPGRRPISVPGATTAVPAVRRTRCGGHRPTRSAARSAQRLRRHQGPPGAPRSRLRPRARRGGDRPALPQRLRAPDAARHAVRRRRRPVRQAVAHGSGPGGLRGRRPTRDFVTWRTSPGPTSSPSRAPNPSSARNSRRRLGPCSSWPGPRARGAGSEPESWAGAARDVRHRRLPEPGGRAPGIPGGRALQAPRKSHGEPAAAVLVAHRDVPLGALRRTRGRWPAPARHPVGPGGARRASR